MQISLRTWEERDAPSLAFFANEPLIAKNLRAGFPSPYGLDDAKAYIAFCHQMDPAETLCLAITNDDTAVGSIGVFCRGNGLAELGYWLGKPYWGKGIMTKMITEICDMAFRRFSIDEIFAEPYEWNAASQRVLERRASCMPVLRKNPGCIFLCGVDSRFRYISQPSFFQC